MEPFQEIESQRLYRTIAEKIAARIRSGELKVGDRLPAERDLAQQLGVSRSSIREALIALEIGGYIEVRVGTGIFVCSDSGRSEPIVVNSNSHPENIGPFDLLEIRMLLEPKCAALAAQYGSPEQLAEIGRLQQNLLPGGGSRQSVLHSKDREFHLAIAAASGNAALQATIANVWDLCESSQMYRKLFSHFRSDHVWKLADEEHRRIANAIADRDPTRAHNAMMGHLINITNRLQDDIASNGPYLDEASVEAGIPARIGQ